MEKDNAIWVIVGNKYREGYNNLTFLQNIKYNLELFTLFTDNIDEAMKFTQEEKDEVYSQQLAQGRKIITLDKDTAYRGLLYTDFYYIALEELENCLAFTKKTVFEI